MNYKYDKYAEHVGTLFIIQNKHNPNQYELLIDEYHIATFPSPEKAAEAVSNHTTGEPTWDNLDGPSNPYSLDEWEILE